MERTPKFANIKAKSLQVAKSPLFLSFIIPVLVMLLLFIIVGIWPFGDRSFLSGDLYHQYMPFFEELMNKVKAGESLHFSFNVGIGSNFLALFGYYLASPFNWLAFLVPQAYLSDFIGYMIVIKVGLCGLTAAAYLRKRFVVNDLSIVLFSCFYAFCGFMTAYSYNIMWVDCVVLLPMILMGLEKLVKEGKGALYCAMLALCILTNFYLSIMICIFLVLYFGVLLVAHKKRFRSIGLFVVYSLLAGGIAAVLLLPEVCALLETDFGDMLFPEEMEFYFSIPEVFARHSFLVLNERGLAHWPNIYCGSAVYMLLPMYLLNHKISLREKLGKVAILGIFLLSFSTNVLDFIWHGMNYPDSLPARQSFLYCFLVVTMCYEAYYRVKEVRLWQILVGYFVGTAFLVYSMIFVDSRHYLPGSRALTLLFMTAFAILLCLYRVREEATFRKVVAFLALVAVVVECSVNTGCTSINNTGRSAYLKSLDDYENLYLQTQEKEEGFYRLEKFHRKTKNDSMLSNYPSATVFSSTMNSYVMDMYERLGMRYSKVYYSFDGATALSGALLSVHYMFGDSHEYENSLYTLVGQSGDVYLYEANTRLPFGWVGPTGFDLPDSPRAIGLHNDLAVSLGIKDRFFTYEGGKASGNDVAFTAKTKGIYYAIMTAGGTSQVTYTGGPAGEETFTDIKDGRIMLLGELEAGQSILLKNADEDDDTPKLYASIYRMNEEVLQQVIAILSEQHMENVVCESDFVSGEITLEKAGRLVLSVPYEAGWDVRINGKEAEGSLFGGCLMAFDLEPGHYEIEMHNTAKGFYQGLALTGGSLAVYLLLLLLEKKKKAHEEEQIVVENTATL